MSVMELARKAYAGVKARRNGRLEISSPAYPTCERSELSEISTPPMAAEDDADKRQDAEYEISELSEIRPPTPPEGVSEYATGKVSEQAPKDDDRDADSVPSVHRADTTRFKTHEPPCRPLVRQVGDGVFFVKDAAGVGMALIAVDESAIVGVDVETTGLDPAPSRPSVAAGDGSGHVPSRLLPDGQSDVGAVVR